MFYPVEHGVQDEEPGPEYVTIGHISHAVWSGRLYVPAVHWVQDGSPEALIYPSKQSSHELEPIEEYFPALQLSQLVRVPELYFPAAHWEQLEAPIFTI